MNKVETDRLLLRAPREDDAPALLAIRNSGFVRRFNPMSVWDEKRMRGEIRVEIENDSAYYIERKADGALLGMIGVEEDELRYRVRAKSVSYYLGEAYARQGYMKEALRAVIRTLFAQDTELEVVSARVFRGNMASERLLLSLGFTCDGCIRRCVRMENGTVFDDMQFSLLRGELR